jgi:hypothetical protein
MPEANPFIAKAERENPFVVQEARKRQERAERARRTMLGHVRALSELHARMEPGAARERIAGRLAEAKRAAGGKDRP